MKQTSFQHALLQIIALFQQSPFCPFILILGIGTTADCDLCHGCEGGELSRSHIDVMMGRQRDRLLASSPYSFQL